MSKVETFKTTEKGTQLPLLNLKGKAYLQVAHRLVWFREQHPEGCIMTEVTTNGETSDAKASIAFKMPDGSHRIVATGHKRETYSNFPDHREKAETGAIGRALAIAGFGTQFEPELDEQERIVDAPVLPAVKEVSIKTPLVERPAPKPAQSELPPSDKLATLITNSARVVVAKKLKTWDQLKEDLKAKWGVEKKEELTPPQAKECYEWLLSLTA